MINTDIVDIAIKEIGYKETGDNGTKYGAWIGMNGAKWCHLFVSWCSNQAGISTSIVPRTASTSEGMEWFRKRGIFKKVGAYTPVRGDIIYFKSAGASHVGIVEYTKDGEVHTIEGNTSDKVARRSYSLSYKTITGYGKPQYSGSSVPTGGSGETTQKRDTTEELKLLKKLLEKKKPEPPVKMEVEAIKSIPDVKVSLIIQNGKKTFEIPVLEDMQLKLERCGMPGVLTFKVIVDKDYSIQEGNSVLLMVDNKKIFYGFVFVREKTKDNTMSITAYDQLRYLKNKDLIIYANKSATELIKTIATKFNLKCGNIAETAYKMTKVECDATLFDIIQSALDETFIFKSQLYVFYDEVGKLTLKNVGSLKVNTCVVDEETGENYTYRTSIDDDTFNQVKLVYKDENNLYKTFVVKDSKNINNWGLLQYMETIDAEEIGKLKAEVLLKCYNRKTRNLTIDNAFGNTTVKGGSLIPVFLNLGDVKVQNYMLVEKVVHKFNNRQHSMDLTLSGGDFVV